VSYRWVRLGAWGDVRNRVRLAQVEASDNQSQCAGCLTHCSCNSANLTTRAAAGDGDRDPTAAAYRRSAQRAWHVADALDT
jgi:hypothetical protein